MRRFRACRDPHTYSLRPGAVRQWCRQCTCEWRGATCLFPDRQAERDEVRRAMEYEEGLWRHEKLCAARGCGALVSNDAMYC